MMNTFKVLVALMIVIGLQSCANEERKTASGFTYTVIEEGAGGEVEDGQYILMNMLYKDETDSVWVTTAEQGIPMVVPKNDSVWSNSESNIEQIFNELKEGDSISFDVSVKDFFEKTARTGIPPNVNKEGTLTFLIGVSDVLNEEEFNTWRQDMMEKQQKKMEADAAGQLDEDVAAIEEYLEKEGIDAERTESGIFYVMEEEGTGEQAKVGDTVMVNYSGHVLNGPFFDTNIKDVAQKEGLYNAQRDESDGYQPLEFPLGQGRVIQGWDEGIALLKEGGKATLYIPSPLAYGPRQRSEEIKANSILVFDVELIGVE